MRPEVPVFYFDIASPFAYLSSSRVDARLGSETRWQPILVGALHQHYRRGGWGTTPETRARGVAEIERRGREYGLPPFAWPDPYPANSLTLMRAATWADQQGAARRFAQCAFAMAFAEGIDLSHRGAILDAARRAGLDHDALAATLDDPSLKDALRHANDEAIAARVYGVPTFEAAGRLWFGDDQLIAAQHAHESQAS